MVSVKMFILFVHRRSRMKKVMRKVKCQWITAAVLGSTIVALGAVDVPQITAVE
jgi:hypothetical protein